MAALIINIVCGVITTVLAAVILAVVKSGQKVAHKREEDRDQRENLTLEALDALFSISKEQTKCIRGERPNGELTEAYEYMQQVKHRINDYQRERAARNN